MQNNRGKSNNTIQSNLIRAQRKLIESGIKYKAFRKTDRPYCRYITIKSLGHRPSQLAKTQ